MSVGGSKSSSSNQSQSQSSAALDPQLKAAYLGNYAGAQNLVANSSYNPLGASTIQNYENPFTQSVIDTTNNNLNLQRQQELQQDNSTATAQNAYGGDRAVVAQALTNEAADRTMASTDAGLNAANYSQALGVGQTENTAQNQYPLNLQELLNASLGIAGNPALTTSSSSGSGSSSEIKANYGS